MLQPGRPVSAPPDACHHLLQGGGDGLDRLKQVLQQSARRAADAECKVKQLLGVQQQLAASQQQAASLDVSSISNASIPFLACCVRLQRPFPNMQAFSLLPCPCLPDCHVSAPRLVAHRACFL